MARSGLSECLTRSGACRFRCSVIVTWQDETDTTQAAYVNQGPSIYDPLIYMDRSGTKSYHLFNHLGTTLALASSSPAPTDSYRRNAWGVELASTGSTTNPFGYADLNTYWLRARVYDPRRGRFISRDPVRDEANLYRWPGNSPVMQVDPSGRQGYRGLRRRPEPVEAATATALLAH